MKRVLIVKDEDFVADGRRLWHIKPQILEMEPDSDDVFYVTLTEIICLKAREHRSGRYCTWEFIKYLTGL